MTLGAAGAPEVLPSQQRQAVALQQAHQARLAVEQARAALAQAIGLPREQMARMALRFDSLMRTPIEAPENAAPGISPEAVLDPLDLQRAALLNNVAVRIALARYAATDAALRLEIARQVPELSLKPGYAWDQGDHRWSLGIGYALPLLNRNDAPIAEAMARRAAEAARFDALQAQAIAELDAARLVAAAASARQAEARQQAQAARTLSERIARRVEQGDADRLERITGRRAELDARRALAEARAALGNARAALEDLVQRPLAPVFAALVAPSAGSAAESAARLVVIPTATDRTR
jgi:outer membrane protein TolC